MSLLQDTALLQSTGHHRPKSPTKSKVGPGKQPNGSQALPSSSSLAALVNLVRNPVATVGQAVEGWYDGMTPVERARRQAIEQRKHLLYIKLRDVSIP